MTPKASLVHALHLSLSNLQSKHHKQVTIEISNGDEFKPNQSYQHIINIILELIKHLTHLRNLRIIESLFNLEHIAAATPEAVLDHFNPFQASKHTTGGSLKLSGSSQHCWQSSTSKPDSILQEVSLKTQTP